MDIVNPHHLAYMLSSPHTQQNNLNVFFHALSMIDPLARRWLLGFVNPAIGAGSVPDGLSEEEEADAELTLLKARCAELVASGTADFFLVYSMVAYVCNHLRSQGDPVATKANLEWLREAAEFFQQRLKSDEASEATAMAARRAEEAINNQRANTELFRDRYNLFCNTVVKALLPPSD